MVPSGPCCSSVRMFCDVAYPMAQFFVYGSRTGAFSWRHVAPRSVDTAKRQAPVAISEYARYTVLGSSLSTRRAGPSSSLDKGRVFSALLGQEMGGPVGGDDLPAGSSTVGGVVPPPFVDRPWPGPGGDRRPPPPGHGKPGVDHLRRHRNRMDGGGRRSRDAPRPRPPQ